MDKNSISSIEKKISLNKQKGYHMNSTNELKLKITHLFGKLNPKNQDGFLNKMKEYDLYSKLELSEEELNGGSSKEPSQNANANIMPPQSPDYLPPVSPNASPANQRAYSGTPEYAPSSPRFVVNSQNYPPQSPIYAPASPDYAPPSENVVPIGQSPSQYMPKSPDFPPQSNSNSNSGSVDDDFDLDDLAQFAEANEEFLDEGEKHKAEPTYQAKAAKEIIELYTWWTVTYRNRPDPYDASGWSEYCEKARILNDGRLFGSKKTPELEELSTRSHELLQKIEADYAAEDEAMMIRLIKARDSLWT